MTKTASENIAALLREMVEGFTRFHDDLQFQTSESVHTITIYMTAHADDTPKLIGSSGSMHSALRYILHAVSREQERGVQVVIREPVKGRREAMAPFKADPEWKPERVSGLLNKILSRLCRYSYTVEYRETSPDTTVAIVTVDPSEEYQDAVTEDALSRILNAIGKSNGRKLFMRFNDPTKGQGNESNPPIPHHVSG